MPINPEIVRERLKMLRRAAGFDSLDKAIQETGFPIAKGTMIGWESSGQEPGLFRVAELVEWYSQFTPASLEYVVGLTDDPSGIPVHKRLLDVGVVSQVESARTWSDLRNVVEKCPKCGHEDIDVGVTFPEKFRLMRPRDYDREVRQVYAKLDQLKAREEEGSGDHN